MAAPTPITDTREERDTRDLTWGFGDHGDAHLAIATYEMAVRNELAKSASSHLAVLPPSRAIKVELERFKLLMTRAEACPDFYMYVQNAMLEQALYDAEVLGEFEKALKTIEALLRAQYGIGGVDQANLQLSLRARRRILLLAAYSKGSSMKPPLWWVGRLPMVGQHVVNAIIDRELAS